VTVIHVALLTAVQLQPSGAVTLTVPGPPADVSDCDVGAMVKVQGTPACVTLNVLPPIVSVPVRDSELAFAAALNETEPLPDPDGPAVTVNHVSLLTADHAHPVGAVTVIVPVPPPATTDCDVGEIV